jgi:hypothetical protein
MTRGSLEFRFLFNLFAQNKLLREEEEEGSEDAASRCGENSS